MATTSIWLQKQIGDTSFKYHLSDLKKNNVINEERVWGGIAKKKKKIIIKIKNSNG